MRRVKPWQAHTLPFGQSAWLPIAIGGLLLTAAMTTSAAPKAGGGNEALLKAQGMIRQLTQEKTALQAEKTAWATEKADLEQRVQALEALIQRLKPLAADAERLKVSVVEVRSHLESELGQERQRHQGLLQRHKDVLTKAKAIQSDNQLLVNAVQERERWIGQCTEQNRALQSVNREILARYQDKGFWQKLAELEPFTGIGAVETENMIEDYHYKLDHLQITPFHSETPGTPESQPAAPPVPDEEGAS